MSRLAVGSQGVPVLMLAYWRVKPCPGISGCRALVFPELLFSNRWVWLIPDTTGCRTKSVPKLVLSCWWVGPVSVVAG